MRKLVMILCFLSLYGCGPFNQGYNHSYHDMPPPLALYFDDGIRHLSFSAKLALLDRVDYMNNNPDLQAEIVGYADEGQGVQLAQIVEREFISQGISSSRIKIISTADDTTTNPRPHVAIRLK